MVFLLGIFSLSFGITYTDSALGFSITLPDNWRDTLFTSDCHIYKPSDPSFRAILGVNYYPDIGSSDKKWCVNSSWAYQLKVEYDPIYGVIYAIDSLLQDSLFAMYANAQYGYPVIAEHIRWVAYHGRGYELYSLGDTLDFKTHYIFYKSFLNSVKILREPIATEQVKNDSNKGRLPAASPNPFRDHLNLNWNSGITDIKLYSPGGRIVWSSGQNGRNFSKITFDSRRELGDGVYFLRYQCAPGVFKTITLVKLN